MDDNGNDGNDNSDYDADNGDDDIDADIYITRVSPGLVHYWRNALNRKKLFGVPKSKSVRYKTSLFCIIYMD